MLADLDLLLIAVFCAADDLLPKRAGNGRRIVTRRGGRHARSRASDHRHPL
jgi:hypothetical protein